MSFIKKILKKLMNIIPMRNLVLLESNPDMSDNTYSLFSKMIEKGYNRKYRFVWLVNNLDDFKNVNIKNVSFFYWKPTGFFRKLRKAWLLYTAKYIIYCNKFIEKRRSGQCVVSLGHGTMIKSVKQHQMMSPDCDFTLCASKEMIPMHVDQLHLTEGHMFVSGLPRNDLLFESKGKLKNVLGNMADKKCIIWMPTFRKQKSSDRLDSEFDFPLGLPIIYDTEALNSVNETLKNNDTVMLLKLHPAQDTSFIKAGTMSNLMLLTDSMLEAAGVKLYEILADTAALITDYSSIYCDYLLLKRPIGVTLDDFKEYSAKNGFAFDNPLEILRGVQIYKLEQLITFIEDVAAGNDVGAVERAKVEDLFNEYKDGGYCQFVLDKMINEYKF